MTEGTNKSNQYFISPDINLVQLIFIYLTKQQAQSKYTIHVSLIEYLIPHLFRILLNSFSLLINIERF